MAFFHLKNVPGHPWPALPDAAFAPVWNAYLELERTQWLTAADLEQCQLRQVRAVLEHCLRHVPYYREVLTAAGIVASAVNTMEDFRQIPRLPRRIYQERPAAFIAEQLPAGTMTNEAGVPVPTHTNVPQTQRSWLWRHACYLRDLEWCDIDPTGTVAIIQNTDAAGAESPGLMHGVTWPTWSPELESLIEMGLAYIMDVRQDPCVHHAWLRQVAPEYLVSTIANLEALAPLARAEGPIPRLRVIQATPELLPSASRAHIEAAFGVPVKNSYCCAEAGYLASPCTAHGLHVHAENILLEVLDTSGQPCAPGQRGQVYVTSLHNLRAPLVRYELGDEAAADPAPCLCGRGLPKLTTA
jgi:phenylacetate-CoA ligase